MTREEEEMWETKVGELNQLHTELQKKPGWFKKGYTLAPGSILNAYREGDLSFDDAVKQLRVVEAEGAERPIEIILKALNLIRGQLVLIGSEPYRAHDVIYPPMEELGDILKKLEAATNVDV